MQVVFYCHGLIPIHLGCKQLPSSVAVHSWRALLEGTPKGRVKDIFFSCTFLAELSSSCIWTYDVPLCPPGHCCPVPVTLSLLWHWAAGCDLFLYDHDKPPWIHLNYSNEYDILNIFGRQLMAFSTASLLSHHTNLQLTDAAADAIFCHSLFETFALTAFW